MQMSFSERNEGGRSGALVLRMGMEIRKNPFKILVDQKIRLIKHIGESTSAMKFLWEPSRFRSIISEIPSNAGSRTTLPSRANDIANWTYVSVSFLNENDDQRQSSSDTYVENLSESRIPLHCLIREYWGAFLKFSHLIKRD